MPDRFITPSPIIAKRFHGKLDRPRWDVAVLSFRDRKGSDALVRALRARPLGRKILWGMEETAGRCQVHSAEMDGKRIGVVADCQWGGPQAAIFVEELAELGLRCLIGIGAAGAIDPALSQGAQIVVANALPTDGTSRHYSAGPYAADPDLLGKAKAACPVVAATVDAIYRETPSLLNEWRAMGAQVVNMEVSAFYAASSACGVRALWLGHVSDVLSGDWKDWYVDREAMTRATIENCLTLIRAL